MKQRLRDLEARELWIEARVDELMDDEEWKWTEGDIWVYLNDESEGLEAHYSRRAKEQAIREHASIIADLEEALIDSGVRE